jgi:hypothetical protein
MSDCSIIQKIQFPDVDIVLFVFSFAEEKLRLAKVATTHRFQPIFFCQRADRIMEIIGGTYVMPLWKVKSL